MDWRTLIRRDKMPAAVYHQRDGAGCFPKRAEPYSLDIVQCSINAPANRPWDGLLAQDVFVSG
jgi:hypothetical protein